MDKSRIRVIAMDLDGTLTQHKQPLSPQTRSTLEALGRRYRLLMVGAGQAQRIFRQMERFPIDIIGNYGMQYAAYDAQTDSLRMLRDEAVTTADRGTIEAKVTALREKHGYTGFAGDSVEYHPSGCLTFPLLGTMARQEDKLAFLHDRFGEDTDRLIELFRKAHPKHDILDLAYTDTVFRIPTMKAALKHAENGLNNTDI